MKLNIENRNIDLNLKNLFQLYIDNLVLTKFK